MTTRRGLLPTVAAAGCVHGRVGRLRPRPAGRKSCAADARGSPVGPGPCSRIWALWSTRRRLWIVPGVCRRRLTSTAPFALELHYARNFYGADIARRSLGGDAPGGRRARGEGRGCWGSQWRALFPDVKAGDRITGVLRRASARFFVNGTLRRE